MSWRGDCPLYRRGSSLYHARKACSQSASASRRSLPAGTCVSPSDDRCAVAELFDFFSRCFLVIRLVTCTRRNGLRDFGRYDCRHVFTRNARRNWWSAQNGRCSWRLSYELGRSPPFGGSCSYPCGVLSGGVTSKIASQPRSVKVWNLSVLEHP